MQLSNHRLPPALASGLIWALVFLLWCCLYSALAGTGGGGDMPWDPLLDSLVNNIGGRTLRVILILAIIMAGIGFYFAAEGTFIRSAFGLVIGFSIACAAATWGPAFFGLAAAHTGVPRAYAPHWSDAVPLVTRLLTWWAIVQVCGWYVGDLVTWWRGSHG